jgi:YVTN family beta-propeller protein
MDHMLIGTSKMVLNPNNNWLYLAHTSNNLISVVNLNSKKIDTLQIESPLTLALSANTKHLYVANYDRNIVFAVDLEKNYEITAIQDVSTPVAFAVSLDGKYLYVANHNDYAVSVISVPAYKVIGKIQAFYNPIQIALSADGKRLYVGCYRPTPSSTKDSVLYLVNTQSYTIVRRLTSINFLTIFALPRDEKRLYVASYISDGDPLNIVVVNDEVIPEPRRLAAEAPTTAQDEQQQTLLPTQEASGKTEYPFSFFSSSSRSASGKAELPASIEEQQLLEQQATTKTELTVQEDDAKNPLSYNNP